MLINSLLFKDQFKADVVLQMNDAVAVGDKDNAVRKFFKFMAALIPQDILQRIFLFVGTVKNHGIIQLA